MVQLRLPKNSRVTKGKHFPAPAGAARNGYRLGGPGRQRQGGGDGLGSDQGATKWGNTNTNGEEQDPFGHQNRRLRWARVFAIRLNGSLRRLPLPSILSTLH